MSKPLNANDRELLSAYRDMLKATRNISLVPVDENVAETGATIRARYNLKTPDALQIACAINADSDAFLTNDRALARVAEIRVILLEEIELVSNG